MLRKILFASFMFMAGGLFGITLLAMVAIGFISSGNAPVPVGASTGSQPDITVKVSEKHINALVQREVGNSAAIRNVQVKIQPGNTIVVTGETSVAGIAAPVQATGQLYSDGDEIRVRVTETKLGALPINVDVSQAIDGPIASATRSMLPLQSYRVSGVSTDGGSATIDLVQR